MIVFVFLLSVREFTRNARSPHDNSLLLDIIPKEFWCPYIHRCRICHYLDETLFTPMHQVFRTCIAKAPVPSPAAGPYEMEHPIGRTSDTWVTHYFLLSHLWTQPDTVNLLPVPTVIAVYEPQAVRCWFMERCGYIHFLLC